MTKPKVMAVKETEKDSPEGVSLKRGDEKTSANHTGRLIVGDTPIAPLISVVTKSNKRKRSQSSSNDKVEGENPVPHPAGGPDNKQSKRPQHRSRVFDLTSFTMDLRKCGYHELHFLKSSVEVAIKLHPKNPSNTTLSHSNASKGVRLDDRRPPFLEKGGKAKLAPKGKLPASASKSKRPGRLNPTADSFSTPATALDRPEGLSEASNVAWSLNMEYEEARKSHSQAARELTDFRERMDLGPTDHRHRGRMLTLSDQQVENMRLLNLARVAALNVKLGLHTEVMACYKHLSAADQQIIFPNRYRNDQKQTLASLKRTAKKQRESAPPKEVQISTDTAPEGTGRKGREPSTRRQRKAAKLLREEEIRESVVAYSLEQDSIMDSTSVETHTRASSPPLVPKISTTSHSLRNKGEDSPSRKGNKGKGKKTGASLKAGYQNLPKGKGPERDRSPHSD